MFFFTINLLYAKYRPMLDLFELIPIDLQHVTLSLHLRLIKCRHYGDVAVNKVGIIIVTWRAPPRQARDDRLWNGAG